jgi:hypothetical protein
MGNGWKNGKKGITRDIIKPEIAKETKASEIKIYCMKSERGRYKKKKWGYMYM